MILFLQPLFAQEVFDKSYFPKLIRLDPLGGPLNREGGSTSTSSPSGSRSKFLRILPRTRPLSAPPEGDRSPPPPRFSEEDPFQPDSAVPLEELLYDISVGTFKEGKFVVAQKYLGRLQNPEGLESSEVVNVYPMGKQSPIISIRDNGRQIRYENSTRIQSGTLVRSFPINTLTGVEKSNSEDCVICRWNQPIPLSPSTDICSDLAAAVCQDEDGNSKYQSRFEKQQNQIRKLVEDARSKTAKKMGYKSAEDAVLKNIAKAGFAPVENLSPKAKDFLLSGIASKYTPLTEIFQDSKNCHDTLENLTISTNPQDMTNAEWEEWNRQTVLFGSQQLGRIAIASSFDLPTFTAGFTSQCDQWQKLKIKLTKVQIESLPEEFQALQNICKNQAPLRKKAIEIFRAGDGDEARQARKEFFQRYFRARLANIDILEKSLRLQNQKDKMNNTKYKQELFMIKSSELKDLCQTLDDSLIATPRAARSQINFILSLAKPTVETLLNSIYTENRKKGIMKLLTHAKSEVMGFARRVTSDSEKLSQIRNHLKNLELIWLESPHQESYVQLPGFPFEVLQLDKLTVTPGNPYAAAFTDTSLSYFTDLNAYYTPSIEIGTIRRGMTVTILPLLLSLYDDNPFGFLTILAHEIGHLIGPKMSAINGYDLEEETRSVLACYADPNSINMSSVQAEETMADLVSSEVLASLLSQLPQSRRKSAVLSAVEPFCYFQALSEKQFDIRTGDKHPDSLLRLSGIFGANPDLRNVMNCKPMSTPQDFQSCGL